MLGLLLALLSGKPALPVRALRLLRLRNVVLLLRALGSGANGRIDALDLSHIHHAHRCRCDRNRRTLAYLLNVGLTKRPPGILRQRRLLLVEGDRSGGRSRPRDHAPPLYVGRRPLGARRIIRVRSQNAFPLRSDRRGGNNLH